MHKSFFSYTITRPYPFRWISWVVFIGGIVALVLVSLLNFAVAGHDLISISTQDPNSTIANVSWNKWPDALVSTKASCQTTSLPLGTRLYTNNTAFPYVLDSVWKDNNGTKTMLGSLVYNNQVLQNCWIPKLSIDFQQDNRQAGQIALIPVGAIVTTNVLCTIDSPDDNSEHVSPTYFQLIASYNPIAPDGDSTGTFLSQNKKKNPSLWWGQSLMRLYWAYLMQVYFESNLQLSNPLSSGGISVDRGSAPRNWTAAEATDVDFFHVSCFFNGMNSTGIQHSLRFCDSQHPNISSLSTGQSDVQLPNIWSAVNGLGKANYFSILADVGRSNVYGPNMLADPELLTALSLNLTTVNATIRAGAGGFRWGIDGSGISEVSFNTSSSTASGLGISPAVLATNYQCQTLRAKSSGTLIFTILVADLVFLQAFWTLFKLFVDSFWIEKGPKEWRCCEGCAAGEGDAIPLLASRPVEGT